MSLDGSLHLKEQVKSAIDIVDLIGQVIPLRRQGRMMVGLCPWHDDSRPSFQVNPQRQSFKCWVCDIGGDCFSFVMRMEGVAFPEALKMLAEKAGIEIKPQRPTRKAGGPADELDKKLLYNTMAWAEAEFHRCLLESPEAQPARDYLQERGITAESIDRFHLGYAPNRWDWLLGAARGTRFTPAALEAVGLVGRSPTSGRLYDRFKGRVLFSIRDSQGRPVGTGGRVLPGGTSPAKYLNSPETPLFHKHRLLYGLDLAAEGLRRGRPAIIMEGYTDVILAHQCGFREAMAVLGTALGPEHVRTLKRYTEKIVLVLDGDEAGQKRTKEVLDLFVAQQVDLRVATLPEELDPCDFLLQHGAEAFADILEHRALDALEFAVQAETRGLDIDRDLHRASQALDRLLAIVAEAPRLQEGTSPDARFREQFILQRLAASFRVEETAVRAQLTALRRQGQRTASPVAFHSAAPPPSPPSPGAARPVADSPPAPPAETRATCDPLERALLEELLQHPECVAQALCRLDPKQFRGPTCRLIFEAACRLSDEGEAPTFERLMLEFDQPEVQNLLVALDEEGRLRGTPAKTPAALVAEILDRFEQRDADRRLRALDAALREGHLDPEQQLEELRRIQQQQRARQGLTRPAES